MDEPTRSYPPAAGLIQTPAALVIFDCDGVLIDSEMIFARILGECLAEADFAATLEEALSLGFGRNAVTLSAEIERRFGRALPEGFFPGMRSRTKAAFETELRPVAGVVELLAALQAPRCVASNSHLDRVRHALALTGLLAYFEPHVFSASQVARGKPAPDLFLHAAQRLGVPPGAAIVVEDSVGGVEAACAAGMTVAGFCGASHCRDGHAERLAAAGCSQVFARMADLARFLVGTTISGGG
ncbi:MAG TPA: HAD family hydrolase [Stellaceae bacterium]|nr:HAD family hydrolase [Stellaceae bacterium]